MQRLEAVQDEVSQVMQICAQLTQKVQETTAQLRKIMASTQDLSGTEKVFAERTVCSRTCLNDVSVEVSLSTLSEVPVSSEAPGQYTVGASAVKKVPLINKSSQKHPGLPLKER